MSCVPWHATVARAAAPIDFARDIRPILSENCFYCHGPDGTDRQADLRLDTHVGAAAVLKAGDRGASELYRRVASSDAHEVMPPPDSNRRLTQAEIERLGQWIDEGAAWSEHWSFTPLVRPNLPAERAAETTGRGSAPIDRFVREVLNQEGVAPAPPATAEARLRRVYLDLTGLPPTPAALDEFLADPSPEAYAKVVDRLLQSPAYGERMAWDWLDAARYADTNGYQGDRERTMWPWRDWVVDAFNRNLPYDQFTIWQVAGDLLPAATFEQRLASGFFRNHMINGEGGRIAEENRVEYVFDMTETFGTVWLGLTLNCCRCHDHKFDPLTQTDYYRLFAFFNQTPVDGSGGNPQTAPVLAVPGANQEQEIQRLTAQLADLRRQHGQRAAELAAVPAATPPDEAQPAEDAALADLSRRLEAAEKRLNSARGGMPKVMIMGQLDEPRKTFVLQVGLYNKPGAEVSAGVPGFLPDLPDGAPRDRRGLAQWLVDDAQPLMARVTVNRIWQQFFGVGLVKTPEDFGAQGEIPRHRRLLDWLAADFRDSGWDVKALVRQIVTSDTYQQSAHAAADAYRHDPDNRLLARGPRRRLPAWMIRDQALAISGLLVTQVGGQPVNGYQPPGIWEEATFGKKQYVQDQGAALYRRTLYTFWRRIVAPTMLFDNAPRQVCSVSPLLTNTPLHALTTLNETTYVEASRAMAERVLRQRSVVAGRNGSAEAARSADREALVWAFRLATARRPSGPETDILLSRLAALREQFAADTEAAARLVSIGESPRDEAWPAAEHAAWAMICSLILNLDETITKP